MAVSMARMQECYLPSSVDCFSSVHDRRVRFGGALDSESSLDEPTGQALAESPTVAKGGPCVRFGMACDKGKRRTMEDACVAFSENDLRALCTGAEWPSLSAVFGVFDGHFGSEAAVFTSERIVQNLMQHASFPDDINTALREAFLQTDEQYYKAWRERYSNSGTEEEDAGTTALVTVVWGNKVFHANAGDCRAVVCRRGKSVDLTKDHKPDTPSERQRIEQHGGFVCQEGRLCGELTVARALGDHSLCDWHGNGLKSRNGQFGPLIAEPEVGMYTLEPEDEFMLIGCDGLWDVFSSQRAVEYVRQTLRKNNDPKYCCEQLVAEALNMHTADNVSVVLVCFSTAPPPKRTYSSNNVSMGRSLSRNSLNTLAEALNCSKLS